MIIVNQEKTEIINFNNVMNIEVTNCDEDGFGIFAVVIIGVDDNYRLLGYYKTEERAKEVLQEIWKFYEIVKRYECSSNNGIAIFLKNIFTYQMPER